MFDMYNLIKIHGKFNLGNFIIKSSCKRKLDKVDYDGEWQLIVLLFYNNKKISYKIILINLDYRIYKQIRRS